MTVSVRQQLPATVQALLIGASPQTSAGQNVFLWRDWALDPTKLPAIVLQARRADRADLTHGNGIPHFMATVYLDVECLASAGGDDPTAAENIAETMAEDQVLPLLAGLIIGPPQTFKRITSVESEIEVKADGAPHIARASMRVGFEYEEQYAPVLATALQRIVIVALKPSATGAEIAAIEAALDAGAADATVAGLAGVLAGADVPISAS